MSVIINGGWVMVALLACSVTAIAIVIQKLIILNDTKIKRSFVASVIDRLSVEKTKTVLDDLQVLTGTSGRIATTCLTYYSAADDVLEYQLSAITKPDRQRLESKMNALSIIITVAPVLGLLGTVLGLMDVFSVIALEGTGQTELLSAGISKALITTVAGLSLAIPLMFIFQFLQSRIAAHYDAWDDFARQLIPLCKKRKKNDA
jgi:biopolymer transport protein ExbB